MAAENTAMAKVFSDGSSDEADQRWYNATVVMWLGSRGVRQTRQECRIDVSAAGLPEDGRDGPRVESS